MITTKKELRNCLRKEYLAYAEYMFNSKARYILSRIKREPARMIYSYLKLSRKCDYYQFKSHESIIHKVLYFLYVCRKNRLGESLSLEVGTNNIQPGLMIYHYNNVVNGSSIIGQNCHLHGDNCIGNDGKTMDCPVIGDNVTLGVGAVVIGNITIASNIKIASGAVVIHSFLEEGITIGGIPAKKIK